MRLIGAERRAQKARTLIIETHLSVRAVTRGDPIEHIAEAWDRRGNQREQSTARGE